MQAFTLFCLVTSLCYFIMLGAEYNKIVKGQNWPKVTATVDNAINSLPITKFESNRINTIATIVSWSYIKYSYKLGEHCYYNTEEMGPHLTVFDYIIGPMAMRFPKDKKIEVKYNPANPKESTIGFEIFKPLETLGGSALLFLTAGLLYYYFRVAGLIPDVGSNEVDIRIPDRRR
ncbi:MAG: hypothetical protein KIT34_04380 [Cyanobacteria bacterium TGS_CYA1]|nr:hypothetical protein [Cyanobacteria bacterium TGS_CYA1]MDX2108477.1 hypothetical protein [Candidatus Melainabacteria bacterium]